MEKSIPESREHQIDLEHLKRMSEPRAVGPASGFLSVIQSLQDQIALSFSTNYTDLCSCPGTLVLA